MVENIRLRKSHEDVVSRDSRHAESQTVIEKEDNGAGVGWDTATSCLQEMEVPAVLSDAQTVSTTPTDSMTPTDCCTMGPNEDTTVVSVPLFGLLCGCDEDNIYMTTFPWQNMMVEVASEQSDVSTTSILDSVGGIMQVFWEAIGPSPDETPSESEGTPELKRKPLFEGND